MNNVERNQTQLAELDLLMSMYPNKGELVFDDAAELADLRAALDSGNAMSGGVGFTLHLTIVQVLLESRLCPVRCIQRNLSVKYYAVM